MQLFKFSRPTAILGKEIRGQSFHYAGFDDFMCVMYVYAMIGIGESEIANGFSLVYSMNDQKSKA
jgi:hypothetical protein